MQDRPWTKYWIPKLKNDPNYSQIRFKRLEKGYPPFEIEESLIDTVSLEEFIRIEDNRLPLFIGTQFGIHPNINNIPDLFNGAKLVAILGKSMLSGCVSGVTLYEIGELDKDFKMNKIYEFIN